MTDLYGCSDHNCIYGHEGGMGTNGGCRCEKELHRFGPQGKKAARQIRLLRSELNHPRSENAEMARLLGMSAERELNLRDTLEELLLATEFYISGKSVRNLDEIILRVKRLLDLDDQ